MVVMMTFSSSDGWLFSELFCEDDMHRSDRDIYSEVGMKDRLDNDAITPIEEGFMQGYLAV